ncbi:uncharacterized protein A1O9_09907 [Exophiala aquamarina CBS 119918]|uniref:Amine oxidase n=1 Tax=Exophiala aquamarina CBS 119918 TaxID=1182545 RepID=A0A072P332_9EURO|nr:uncharacterized protein A1O9_09907 [Exophiala aquamarina CBS 119918]KEF54112.1 hypothetical protein A1O9_09907 [Exophiala aquamarina CBS 119918]
MHEIPRSQEGVHFTVDSSSTSYGLPTVAYKKSNVTLNSTNDYDVVVVGAGYTGLIAARNVSRSGKRVLLVEGRDRIGGRTWTVDLWGNKFEMGGEWVHWAQPNVWAELTDYGLTKPDDFLQTSGSAEPEFCSMSMPNSEGSKEYSTSFLDKASLVQSLDRTTKAFFDVDGQGGATIFPFPYTPLANLEAIEKYDSLTVGDRINQLSGFTKEELDFLFSNLVVFGNIPPMEAGFLNILHYYALAGYDWDRLMQASDRYKLKIGHSGFANLVFADIAGDAVFSDPIKAVTHQPGSVVTTLQSGATIRSKHVICTLPLHCLSEVDFQPPLPTPFSKVRHPNFGGKVHIHVDAKIPAWCGFADSDAPVDALLTDRYSSREGTYLAGFPGGNPWRQGRNVVGDPSEFLQATFKSCYPSKWSGKPTDMLWHDWNTDPFSRGQWGAWGAGQISTSFKSLTEAAYVSREIVLANADWAHGWTGFVDGAVEEGKRAASQVLSYLKG